MFSHKPVDALFVDGDALSVFEIGPAVPVAPERMVDLDDPDLGHQLMIALDSAVLYH